MAETWEDVHGHSEVVPTGLARYADWGALPLRLMLGFGFIWHGYPKLFGGHEPFAASLAGLGVPLPDLMAWLVGILEFFGGMALILGLLVVPIAILAAIEMLVAVFALHLPDGFNGSELALVYLSGFLALALMGAGPLSIDAMVRRRTPRHTPGHVGMASTDAHA